MKRNRILIFITLGILYLVPNKVIAQCSLDKSNWQLVFSEEFDQANVDNLLNHGWVVGDPHDPGPAQLTAETCGPGSSVMCFSKNQITLNNGLGHFNVIKTSPFTCQNKTATYENAMISSTFDEFPYAQYQNPGNTRAGYAFGMFEVRCKLPKENYTYPAFWLSGNAWPPEIDAFEYNGGNHNRFFSSVHWPVPNAPGTSQYCSNFFQYSYDLTNDFHTFTLVWTPN